MHEPSVPQRGDKHSWMPGAQRRQGHSAPVPQFSHWLLEKDCSTASPQDASLGSWQSAVVAMVEGKRVLSCVSGQQDKQSAESLACVGGYGWGLGFPEDRASLHST